MLPLVPKSCYKGHGVPLGQRATGGAYLFPCMMTVFATASRLSLFDPCFGLKPCPKVTRCLTLPSPPQLDPLPKPHFAQPGHEHYADLSAKRTSHEGICFIVSLSLSFSACGSGPWVPRVRWEQTDTVSSIIGGDEITIMFSILILMLL